MANKKIQFFAFSTEADKVFEKMDGDDLKKVLIDVYRYLKEGVVPVLDKNLFDDFIQLVSTPKVYIEQFNKDGRSITSPENGRKGSKAKLEPDERVSEKYKEFVK